jgi:hypothetical protein
MTEIPAVANYVVLGVGGVLTLLLFGCIVYLTIYRCLCGVIMCPKLFMRLTGRLPQVEMPTLAFQRESPRPEHMVGIRETEKEPLLSTFSEVGREGSDLTENLPETLVSV